MLPDFPALKNDLQEIFTAYIAREVRRRANLAEVPRHRLFEGQDDAISRQGAKKEPVKMFSAGAEMTVTAEDVTQSSVKGLRAKLDQIAEQMAQQMAQNFYQTLSDECEKSGQVTKGGGGFTADKVLEALDKMHIDFDPNGRPHMPEIHVGPGQVETLKTALEKLETDPEYKKKGDELIEKKFREWRDREASRKLVG